MICPNCGKPLPDGVKFCTGCGARMAPAAPVTPAPAAPAAPAAPVAAPSAPPAAPVKPAGKKPVGAIVAVILALVVIVGAVAGVLLFRNSQKAGLPDRVLEALTEDYYGDAVDDAYRRLLPEGYKVRVSKNTLALTEGKDGTWSFTVSLRVDSNYGDRYTAELEGSIRPNFFYTGFEFAGEAELTSYERPNPGGDQGTTNPGSTQGPGSGSTSGNSGTSGPAPTPAPNPTATPSLDLSYFYDQLFQYDDAPFMMLVEDEDSVDSLYPGLRNIPCRQRIIAIPMMSSVAAEVALIEVEDPYNVSVVAEMFSDRIRYQVNGGAWYPETIEQWDTNNLVLTWDNYVMLYVGADSEWVYYAFEAFIGGYEPPIRPDFYSSPLDDVGPSDDYNDYGATLLDPDDLPDEVYSPDGTCQIAYISNGPFYGGSRDKGTYNGIKLFAYVRGLSYRYYEPAGGDRSNDDDRLAAFVEAIVNGAEVVIYDSGWLDPAMMDAANMYPEVKFLYIGGWEHEMDNVASISFKEEEAGYLAGYAAVREGYTTLGFVGAGGGLVPANNRCGFGFVQGANAAARDMGIQVDMLYCDYDGYDPDGSLEDLFFSWYAQGVEVIFPYGGTMYRGALPVADFTGGRLIGSVYDMGRANITDIFLTSAMYDHTNAAYWACSRVFSGDWYDIAYWGARLGVREGAVCLPTDNWNMYNFSISDYKELLVDISSGWVWVDSDYYYLDSDWDSLNLIRWYY